MSYCVNCGVELERALKKCPLCGVKVINPAEREAAEDMNPLPETRDELKKVDRVFWISFISILSAVPIAICVLCDLLYSKSLTWSLFVIAGVFILWTLSVSAFLFKTFSYFKVVSADMAGILAGLVMLDQLSPGREWLLQIALPIVLYCYLAGLLIAWLTNKRILRGLGISAACVMAVAAMMIMIEMFLDLSSSGRIDLIWSWFILAPCVSVAALLVLLDKNKRFRQELAKRLHI
jgi:hypothetical protein